MERDWHEWHRAYDQADSPLRRRLAIVQRHVAGAFDACEPGPIQVVSMCAGEARDLTGVLASHSRARDVHGRAVELDPVLADRARERLPATVDVVVGDAGISDVYEGAVPANVVLACGVFGNVTDSDIERTISALPTLCAPGATVIWTRHRSAPDITRTVRGWFGDAGFDEVAFDGPPDTIFGVGVHRFTGIPQPFRPHVRLFEFVGYDNLR